MKLLNAGLCLFFLTFATLRAARVPLTYDEAASYIRYIDSSVPSVFDTGPLSVFDFEVATNHFLNTLFTKACSLVAGNSEFVLRLPNLFGYALFMAFSLLILQRAVRPAFATGGFLLLNLNPYVLDFFTLSRGYGLSLGFLMGGMFYVFRFLDRLTEGESGNREASSAMAFACAAVMSNFALLNVWLAIFGVLLVAFALRHASLSEARIPDPASRIPAASTRSWPSRTLRLSVAVLFAGLVFSQDWRLSSSLYEPITVRITGLDEADRDRVRVLRVDQHGRDSRIPLDAGINEWHSPDRVPYRGLRIELPVAEADRLEQIEVAVGSRLFSSDPRRHSLWTRHDRGALAVLDADSASLALPPSRVRHFRSVINWTGDARYAESLGIAAACGLGMLAAFALLLKAVGWAAARLNLLTKDQWCPLERAALWVAALAGPPLYLLKRNSELYFGGTRGLVVDTFYSTIEGSFYGRSYHPAQIGIVFAGIVISVVVFCVAMSRHLRRHTFSSILPAATVVTILAVTSLSLVVQHLLFHTVYLVGRTALFYIPLYALFATLLCEAIARSGRTGRALATTLFAVALVLAAYHFTSTANMKYAFDWHGDASTRMMMEDLEQVVASESGRSRVVLGVEPGYLPVAVYYAHRAPMARIDIVSLSAADATEFQYVEDTGRLSMNVIRRYSLTRTALIRTRPQP